MAKWTKWRAFPDPRRAEFLVAPIGPGVYEVQNLSTGEFILFGQGRNLAKRMTSLLPRPLGSGTRRNVAKRQYIVEHLGELRYRTKAFVNPNDAIDEERTLRNSGVRYRFRM